MADTVEMQLPKDAAVRVMCAICSGSRRFTEPPRTSYACGADCQQNTIA